MYRYCLVIVFGMVSGVSFGAEVVSFNKLQIQVNSSALTAASQSDFVNVTNSTSTSPLAKPFCLSVDPRTSITHPYFTNSSPLLGLKVASCDSGDQQQVFVFENGEIKSNNGLCLARSSSTQTIYDFTGDGRDCLTASHGYARGQYSQNIYETTIRLQSCDGSADQNWMLSTDLINSQQIIQAQSGAQCMSLDGFAYTGSSSSYFGDTVYDVCNYSGVNVAVNSSFITIYNNQFDLKMSSCSSDASRFVVNIPVMQVKQIVPIFIN